MVYYTQLIFVKEGKEGVFQSFEDNVLPLPERHNGMLLYRVRPSRGQVVETSIGHPYEVHFLSFGTKEDFLGYANDPERQQYLPLKNESVIRAMLIEGVQV